MPSPQKQLKLGVKRSCAKSQIDSIIKTADSWENSYVTKYGLNEFRLPPEGGQWGMWYICPYDNTYLQYSPPMTHRCPKCQRTFTGFPYDQVIYGRMHDDLAKYLLRLVQSYVLTKDKIYGEGVKRILLVYTAEMIKRAGLDLTGNEALLSMFIFLVLFSEPDGKLPPFNDSGIADIFGQNGLSVSRAISLKRADM